MDLRTKKLMTMHWALHPRDDRDRLYVSRKEGGIGLTRIEDWVNVSLWELTDFIKKNKGLITAANTITNNIRINRTTVTREQKWEEKQLHGYFKQQTGDISHKETWVCLWKENLKRETGSLPIAAQNRAIRNNYIKSKFDNMQQNSKYRLCGESKPLIT